MSDVSFQGKTAVIVCHDSMPGPPHETLRDYIISKKIARLLFIGHVNQYVVGNPVKCSYLNIYHEKHLDKKIVAPQIAIPEPFVYIYQTMLTLYWILRYAGSHIDIYIGLANLNAIVGIIFRYIGYVSVSIYYVIDYVPKRFSSTYMNVAYHYLDKLCAELSDATWNYGQGMMEAREKKWHKRFPRQIHTPHGVYIDQSILAHSTQYNSYELVYMGTLYEQQGIQLIIESLPLIKKSISSIHLTIIGIGPFQKHLQKMITRLGVNENITFQGFVQSPVDVDMLLSQGAVGIATYKNDIGFVMYTEPGKVKRYLSCGVPVVITEGTPLSSDIAAYECGIVVPFEHKETARRILALLKDSEKVKKMRINAVVYAKQFTWEKIYTRAFQYSL